jgi:hypothetical protein
MFRRAFEWWHGWRKRGQQIDIERAVKLRKGANVGTDRPARQTGKSGDPPGSAGVGPL